MQFTVTLPEWVVEEQSRLPTELPRLEDRMRAVIRLARLNVEYQTGGPFAAGIFERDSGRRIVMGVNRVVPMNVSSAHAEVVTLSIAQQQLNTWDLGNGRFPPLQLVVNWRPCAMCFGAVIWSGIQSLAIAGSDEACERITALTKAPFTPNGGANCPSVRSSCAITSFTTMPSKSLRPFAPVDTWFTTDGSQETRNDSIPLSVGCRSLLVSFVRR